MDGKGERAMKRQLAFRSIDVNIQQCMALGRRLLYVDFQIHLLSFYSLRSYYRMHVECLFTASGIPLVHVLLISCSAS